MTLRPMVADGSPARIGAIVSAVGNFNPAEIRCALELVDIYLGDPAQKDYRFLVAEDTGGAIRGVCLLGPVPHDPGHLRSLLDRHASRGAGAGLRARADGAGGGSSPARRTAGCSSLETSSKESYGKHRADSIVAWATRKRPGSGISTTRATTRSSFVKRFSR